MNKSCILVSLFVLLFLSFVPAKAEISEDKLDENFANKNYIVEVLDVNNVTHGNEYEALNQDVKIKILTKGAFKDKEVWIENKVPDNPAYAVIATKGKRFLAGFDEDLDTFYIKDYFREPALYTLMVVFVALLIILGGSYGFKALASLVLTGLGIIYILIPGIKEGMNPILLAVIISALATASTMLIVAGFSRKALAATIGTTGGVACAGLIAYLAIKLAPFSGMASTEASILFANLRYGIQNILLDFQGILAAGIIIASLGAAMDVAISIASVVQEVHDANPSLPSSNLFSQAMNVGKDIMGTMTNTLILAYTGSSIPLLLLLYNEPGLRFLNMEIIASEVASALIGSTGLLLAIPITAGIASLITPRNSKI